MPLSDPSLLREACLVDGQWIGEAVSPVHNPATGALVGHVPRMDTEATEAAVTAAAAAFCGWVELTGRARGAILRRLAELILENTEDLAAILTAEQGKPLAEARAEVTSAAAYFGYFAEEAARVGGEIVAAPRSDSRILVHYKPIGVVAAITPWNFPCSMVARKLAPSLAAGCSVVLKPAPQTPFSALALADLASRAGVPAGVLNVVTGDAAIIGTALTGDHRVSFVSFTGSTAVGRLLMRQSAPTVKKLGLELGGHAPFIVLADADLDAAATGAFAAKFRNMGQTCVCPNRFFVHESVRAGFMDRLSSHVAGLVTGDGTDPATTQGPLVNTAALAKVEAHVADALAHGARLVCGGTRDPLGGTWYRPTILDGVTDAMLVAQEETFGPVAAISGYDDLDAVIATVNRAPYGLAAYVYGRDLSTILRTAERLDCGMVGLNAVHLGLEMAPIGGTKQSGLGREGSRHGLLDYCEMQYLLVGV